MAKQFNLRTTVFFYFFIILVLPFILLVFGKNRFAVAILVVVFLVASAMAIQRHIRGFKSGKKTSTRTRREVRESEFLVLMIVSSLSVGILIILNSFLAKLLSGVLLVIIFLGLAIDFLIKIVSKRKLPKLLKCLEKDPSLKAFEKVVDSFLSTDDLKNASIYADKAIMQYPNSAILLTYRAVVYRRLHEDGKAVPLIKKALELEPRNRFVREVGMKLQGLGFKVFSPPKSFWKLWP